MLKQRVITGLLLLLVLGGALFLLPYQGFVAFSALLFLLAAWEWGNLSGLSGLPKGVFVLVFALVLLVLVYVLGLQSSETIHKEWVKHVLGLGCTWWALALLWVKSYPASAGLWGARLPRLIIGLLVLVPCWVALVYLRHLPHGAWLIVFTVMLVSGADTGAYFAGKKFGKVKLAPNVSPGKSREGFLGGLCFVGILTAIVGSQFSVAGLGLVALIVIAIVSALASVLGDLLESMLKRHRGIKDSSQLLPGHGGILDRIDSMTAAAPVFTLLLMLSAA
jgi:phosphatidate cytidylyltransferase